MSKNFQNLYRQLLDNPEAFEKRGDGVSLLKEYFAGIPVDTLRPLLGDSNRFVRRNAIFIANELGKYAEALIGEVSLLVSDPDPHIQWDALESVMVSSEGEYGKYFICVVKGLESKDPSIRQLSMRLLSRAARSQIESAVKNVAEMPAHRENHRHGLSLLLRLPVASSEIIQAFDDPSDVVKVYGAIACSRLGDNYSDLIRYAMQSENHDVSIFAADLISRP